MIDSSTETLMSFAEAAKYADVTERTIARWASPVDDSGAMKRSFLESFKRGGKRYTTREAIERFEQHSEPAKLPAAINVAGHSAAMAQLRSMGVIT